MNKPHLERMLRAMNWADQQVLASVRDNAAAQAEALPLLAHMLAAEHVWLCRLDRRDARVEVWPTLTLSECDRLAAENAAGYLALVGGMDDTALAAPLHYRNTKGEEFVAPVIDILTHVVIHGAYHRGQIAKAIGRTGAQAVGTDFIIFARSVEPA